MAEPFSGLKSTAAVTDAYFDLEVTDRTGANLTFTADRFLHGLSASASIRNLFDRRYDVAVNFQKAPDGTWRETLPMDDPTFWLQASYDF